MSPCSKTFIASSILLVCLLLNANSASATQHYFCYAKWTISNAERQSGNGGPQVVNGEIRDIPVSASDIEEAKSIALSVVKANSNNNINFQVTGLGYGLSGQ